MAETRIETCATHGLRYDANRHDRCLLCQRLTAPKAEPAAHWDAIVRWFCGIGVVAGLAIALIFGVGRKSVSRLAVATPESGSSCKSSRASAAESCVQACGHNTGHLDCASDCMAALNDSLTSCPGIKELAPAQVEFVYAAGPAPDWRSVSASLLGPLAKLAACPQARGAFIARLEVGSAAKLVGIAVGTHQREAAPCIAEQLASFDSAGLLRSDYLLVVRGTQPAGAMTALEAARPVATTTPVKTPDPTSPPPAPAAEPTFSIQADEQEQEPLRAGLRSAKRACAGAADGCASALSGLRSHFAALPLVPAGGKSHMQRFALNTLGAGFDCLRVDSERGFETYTTIGLAGDRDGLLRWRLVSAQPIDAYKGDVEVEAAPWPADYRAEVIHLEGLSARDLSLCFDFVDAERQHLWYAGLASYPQSNKASVETNHVEDGLQALGLKRLIPNGEKLQQAITHKNVKAAELLIAQGTNLRSQHAALATAIGAGWPLDKLEMLLSAGADPNQVDENERTAIHAAIDTASSLCPEKYDRPVAEAVKVLLKGGADPNLMTFHGSALHVAAMRGCKLTWDVLVQAGANPRLEREDDGKTPTFLRDDLQKRLAGRGTSSTQH